MPSQITLPIYAFILIIVFSAIILLLLIAAITLLYNYKKSERKLNQLIQNLEQSFEKTCDCDYHHPPQISCQDYQKEIRRRNRPSFKQKYRAVLDRCANHDVVPL